MSTYAGGTDVVGYIKVQPSAGNIKIVKTSSDGTKSGFKFNVKNTTTGYDKNYTTDENGKITISDLPVGVGKYTVTEKMTSEQAKKYIQPSAQTKSLTAGDTVTFNFTNTEKPRTLKIVKQTIIDGVVYKTGPNVAGFHFRVTSKDGTYNKLFTTTTSGVITISGSGNNELKPGNYKVSEELTQAQKDEGYLDNEPQNAKVSYGGTDTKTFINRKDSGLQIIKTSEDGKISGVWFEVEGINGTNFPADEFKTDENGFIMLDKSGGLKSGTYKITELGNEKSDGSYEIPNKYIAPESQIIEVSDGEVASVTFENKLKPGTITIQKTADDGFVDNIPFSIKSVSTLSGEDIEEYVFTDENGSFEGEFPAGTYTVSEQDIEDRYYSNSYQTQTVNLEPGGTVNVTGGADGNMNRNKSVEINLNKIDKNTLKPIIATDGLFELYEYDILNDEYTATGEYMKYENGTYSISKQWTVTNDGQFAIKEIKAPSGYVANNAFITVDAKEHNEDKAVISITITIENCIQRANIGIYKVVEDIESDEDGEAILLGGAKFDIYSAEDIYENGILIYPANTLVDALVTDSENAVISKDFPLGEYYLEETESPYGYVLKKEKINVTLSYQEQEQKTGEDGKIMYGTNEVVYTQYVTFENTPQKGQIEIIKTDAETNKPLANAEYEIYAKEDIVVNNVLKHSKGTLVDTVTTDANGKGISLLLFLGKYEIKELTAPTGYVLDTTVYSVELQYKGQEVSVFTENLTADDERQKVSVYFNKTMEENIYYPNDEAGMIQFLNERLENFQVPKIVQIIKEIPKTFNGKPLKRELKKM